MDGKKDEERKAPGTRRRGEELEKAILQAAWDELGEAGYAKLTMEGVAARAQTNKNAVYRRWPNKPALVIAAYAKIMPKPSFEIPDTGSLRGDLFALLERLAKPLQSIGAETIHGIMVDYHGKELMTSLPQMMKSRTEDKLAAAMREILKRAVERGEANAERLTDRVMTLPADLIRFEVLATHEPISDRTLEEIIDDIFLPIVLANPQPQ